MAGISILHVVSKYFLPYILFPFSSYIKNALGSVEPFVISDVSKYVSTSIVTLFVPDIKFPPDVPFVPEEIVCQVGALPVPADVRTCPDVPVLPLNVITPLTVNVLVFVLPFTINDAEPVPSYTLEILKVFAVDRERKVSLSALPDPTPITPFE